MAGSLKVVATKMGFYGLRRRYPSNSDKPGAGQPFMLKKKEDFSERWMQWVDGGPDGKAKAPVAKDSATEPTRPAPPPGSAGAAKLKAVEQGEQVEAPPAGSGPAKDEEI